MVRYIPTIGMEIHVELKTESKMFCDSKNETEKALPNTNICPVCTGQPGTLPVPNWKAIEFVQLAGMALNCNLRKDSKFDRKNYFYPDLPKGYQISQYDQPLCEKGFLEVESPSSQKSIKRIGITRIHLEEDTGKLVHPKNSDYTLVDFNRAGVPLMELVTEPDMESGEEARKFCEKLQQIFRYLEISDADMEKGQMRCEVNISLHKEGEDRLSGTKVEVKNINSFKFVEKAINYEIKRQAETLEKGEKIIQETRGYDSNQDITVSQRTKESAHDYRYFPEPDIPPFSFTDEYFAELKLKLPELPDEKTKRFIEQYSLSEQDALGLTVDKDYAEFFEQITDELAAKCASHEAACPTEKLNKLAVNYILSELKKHFVQDNSSIKDLKFTAENYAELIAMIADGKINSSAAQIVLEHMFKHGGDPSQIVEEKNLGQMSDEGAIESAVDEVLSKNQKSVEDYKSGKTNALQFLMGQVMSATKGKANPKIVSELLRKKIG